jgi:hypothetical protein
VTTADLIFLCALFVGFLAFAGYVAENWPRHDPTSDELHDRRMQAHPEHFRQAHKP